MKLPSAMHPEPGLVQVGLDSAYSRESRHTQGSNVLQTCLLSALAPLSRLPSTAGSKMQGNRLPRRYQHEMFSGELADYKLTRIKRRIQLRRRALLRRRVHHQGRPRQGRRSRDRHERRPGAGRWNLKLETDGRGDRELSTLIPVLQEAEFSRRGPWRPRPRWGSSEAQFSRRGPWRPRPQ